MNCRRVEELIPLYAGRDVDRRLTAEVQTHLENCLECGQLAAEFEASTNWLAGATPELDEAVLVDMKRRVMAELHTVKTRPRWFELMSGMIAEVPWGSAVAAALLLIVFGALSFWVFVGREASTSPTEAKAPTEQLVDPERLPSEPGDNSAPRTPRKRPRIGLDHHRRVVRFSNSQRRQPGAADQLSTRVADRSREPHSPSLLPVDSERMLRIEIQTGDPSIRIIWFAPEEVDSQQINP